MQCYVVSLLVYDLELHESTPSVDGSSQQTNRHSASPAPSPGINKKEVTQKMVCLSWLHKKAFVIVLLMQEVLYILYKLLCKG